MASTVERSAQCLSQLQDRTKINYYTHHSRTHLFQQSEYEKDNYDGQMIFGDLLGLKFHDICLTGEETPPQKKPHLGNLFRPRIKPGPTAWQASMLPPVPQRWAQLKLQSENPCFKSVKVFPLQTINSHGRCACKGPHIHSHRVVSHESGRL